MSLRNPQDKNRAFGNQAVKKVRRKFSFIKKDGPVAKPSHFVLWVSEAQS